MSRVKPSIERSLYTWCIENKREFLLKEWDYDLNELTPKDYFAHSEKEVMWKCVKYGHSYPAQIAFRTKKKIGGCCFCAGKRILVGFNDLGSLNIAKEYSDKNEKSVNELFRTSNCKVLWKCSICNREYLARISDRVLKKSGCQYCGGKLPILGINDLKTWCKKNQKEYLLEEWNNVKSPEEYKYASNELVEWKCSVCGNIYKKQIDQRTLRDFGCKKCSIGGTSFPEQFVYFLMKHYFKNCKNRDKSHGFELDIYIPDFKIGIEYNGRYFHSSDGAIISDRWKIEESRKTNVNLLIICENENILNLNENFIIWKYSKGIDGLYGLARQIIDWVNYTTSSNYRVDIEMVENVRTQVIKRMAKKTRENNLANMYPQIAGEWDYEKNSPIVPENVAAGSHDCFSWKCSKCGNSWDTTILNRIKGCGCPKCGKEKQIASWKKSRVNKYNFMQWCVDNKKEYLLLDWDYERNVKKPIECSYGSNDVICWCHHITGHKWEATISNRRNSNDECQCRKCSYRRRSMNSNRKKLDDGMSLFEWCIENNREELIEEWDYKKNERGPEDYLRGSSLKVNWLCSVCGASFISPIKTRTYSKKILGVCRHRRTGSECYF